MGDAQLVTQALDALAGRVSQTRCQDLVWTLRRHVSVSDAERVPGVLARTVQDHPDDPTRRRRLAVLCEALSATRGTIATPGVSCSGAC